MTGGVTTFEQAGSKGGVRTRKSWRREDHLKPGNVRGTRRRDRALREGKVEHVKKRNETRSRGTTIGSPRVHEHVGKQGILGLPDLGLTWSVKGLTKKPRKKKQPGAGGKTGLYAVRDMG